MTISTQGRQELSQGLMNHSFRDVVGTLVQDSEFATMEEEKITTWHRANKELWMCGASEDGII